MGSRRNYETYWSDLTWHDIWLLTYNFWLLSFDIWYIILHLIFDIWLLTFDIWHLARHDTHTCYWHNPNWFSLIDYAVILAVWKVYVITSESMFGFWGYPVRIYVWILRLSVAILGLRDARLALLAHLKIEKL